MASKRKIGIVGYGNLGKYLTKAILEDKEVNQILELAFVWNRTIDKIDLPQNLILKNLDDFAKIPVDLIIEVSHPLIVKQYGTKFLQYADLMIGSPTSLADSELESDIRRTADTNGRDFGCYIPSGALWGAEDIAKMSSTGNLAKLTITMKKHPSSLKVEDPLMEKLKIYAQDQNAKGEFVLYEGPVRPLCTLAPNNVNTMACAALAASTLGFDGVTARLVADKKLEAHVIDIETEGPRNEKSPEEVFRVSTVRYNPAKPGAVTGNATYASFLSSMVRAGGRGKGFHFC